MTMVDLQFPDVRESQRQRAVDALGLAEHEQHPRLDRITRLARSVLGMDGSTITVLDHDRAWFPSAAGLERVAMPRSQTFCDHTTRVDETVVVPDAPDDRLFRDLDAVRSGMVGFYAGHPLHDSAGNVLGTLCVFADSPRELEGEQLATFLDLAAWAEHELVANAEMDQARRVQVSLLPPRPLDVGEWQVAGTCLPSLAVGGDLFDYGLSQGVLQVGLGDVMGKGTGAALVGAGVRAAIRGTTSAVAAGVDLGVTTTQVARRLLHELERADSFVTLFQLAVSVDDGAARYVDAGSGLALLVAADGGVVRLQGEDRPLGVLADDHWTEHEVTIGPGERLLLFSDGLLDLFDEDVDLWAEIGRLVSRALDVPDLMAAITRLTTESTPIDDVTAVAVFRAA